MFLPYITSSVIDSSTLLRLCESIIKYDHDMIFAIIISNKKQSIGWRRRKEQRHQIELLISFKLELFS